MKGIAITIILLTITLYIFGSICAATMDIKEWNELGRVTLAIMWLYGISKIETENE